MSVAVTHCVGSRSGGNTDQMKELNAVLLTNTTLARLIKGEEYALLCDVTFQLEARVFSAPMIPAPTLGALSEVLSLSQQVLVKGDTIHRKIQDIPTSPVNGVQGDTCKQRTSLESYRVQQRTPCS